MEFPELHESLETYDYDYDDEWFNLLFGGLLDERKSESRW